MLHLDMLWCVCVCMCMCVHVSAELCMYVDMKVQLCILYNHMIVNQHMTQLQHTAVPSLIKFPPTLPLPLLPTPPSHPRTPKPTLQALIISVQFPLLIPKILYRLIIQQRIHCPTVPLILSLVHFLAKLRTPLCNTKGKHSIGGNGAYGERCIGGSTAVGHDTSHEGDFKCSGYYIEDHAAEYEIDAC